MANLETKTKYIVGFWRPKETDPETIEKGKRLGRYFEKNAETFAFILHDLDVDPKTGERATPHIHFVATMSQTKRIGTWLNEIADALEVDPQSVTASKASSVSRSLRYLAHKDNPEKHQYPIAEIFHNWQDGEFQKVFAGKCKEEVDFDFLVALIRRSRTITDVIAVLGVGSYRYWRPVITDMWRDCHNVAR